jgi:hypothetical protein
MKNCLIEHLIKLKNKPKEVFVIEYQSENMSITLSSGLTYGSILYKKYIDINLTNNQL